MAGILDIIGQAMGQTPTVRALRNTRMVNMPDASSALLDPAVMAEIERVAGMIDAGGGVPTPLVAGDAAAATGRVPISATGFGNGQNLPPEIEQVLREMSQQTDPAAASFMGGDREYNLRRSAAAEKAAKIQQDAAAAQRFSDPSEVAFDNAVNSRGQVDPRQVAALQKLRDDPGRQALFEDARNNVNLLAQAAGLTRKRRLGLLPEGVGDAALLGAVAPTEDMQWQINPKAMTAQGMIENEAQETANRLQGVQVAADGRIKEAKINAAGNAKAAKAEARGRLKAAKVEVEANRAVREAQVAQAKAAQVQAEAQAKLDTARGTREEATAAAALEQAKQQNEINKLTLDKMKREAEHETKIAEQTRKNDPFKEVEDVNQKTDLWTEKVMAEPTTQNIEAFMRHVYTNRGDLYGASWFTFDEGDFEEYILSKIGGVKTDPMEVRRLAEQFWERRTGSF